jgi:hypothetical protein
MALADLAGKTDSAKKPLNEEMLVDVTACRACDLRSSGIDI